MKSPSGRLSLLQAPKKKTVKVTSFKVCIGVILLHFLGILSHLIWLSNQNDTTSHESSEATAQFESPSSQLRSVSREKSGAKVETNLEVQKQSEILKEDRTITTVTADTTSGSIIRQTRLDFDLAENIRLLDMQQQVGQQLQLDNLQSCRWYRRTSHGIVVEENHVCNHPADHDGLWVYNPASYQRTWCDRTLPPKTTVFLSVQQPFCLEPPRIFPRTPTAFAHGMPPIHLVPTHGRPVSGHGQPFDCDVPCEITGGDSLVSYRSMQGTNWKFIYSMEGSHYYPELNISKNAYLEDTYFATTSFQSDIPLPYFSWAEYNITDPAVNYDHVIAGASFIARNCGSLNHREAVVETLMTYIRVDSLSSCVHNADPPNGMSMDNKKLVQREYLFHLAFENSCEDDYITEKLWGTFEAGTLPIYLGAPNVKDHVPPHSIISVHDFETTEALGVYLQQVAANKTLYESYHAWRTKPLPDAFQRKFNFTHTHSLCRMCRWAYAKKYGLGWDHASQKVEELPRQLFRDDNGVITKPFRESWLSDQGQALRSLDHQEQQQQALQQNHESKEGHSTGNVDGWERTVWEHDGVIDLSFQAPANKVVIYRMETDITGSPVHFNPTQRTVLQDNNLRMTVLTSWNSSVSSPQPGMMDFTLEGHGTLRMRVIVESVDTLHEGGRSATYSYYFGSFMAEDFFQPIELFRVTDS